jgi:hypothetical protein
VFGKTEWIRSRRELIALGESGDADVALSVKGDRVAVHLQLAMPERAWLERVLRRGPPGRARQRRTALALRARSVQRRREP